MRKHIKDIRPNNSDIHFTTSRTEKKIIIIKTTLPFFLPQLPVLTVQMATYKSSSTSVFTIPKKMTAKTTPVEVGTRGTVGSLILQEIEYLRKIELGCQESSCKSKKEAASTSSNPSAMPRKPKKKKMAGSRLIPKMCDMVEIADNRQPKTIIHGFTYRNLKAEIISTSEA